MFEKEQSTHIDLIHVLPPGLSDDERKERLDELYEGLEGRLLLYKQARHPVRSRVLDTLDFFRTGERMTKAEGE